MSEKTVEKWDCSGELCNADSLCIKFILLTASKWPKHFKLLCQDEIQRGLLQTMRKELNWMRFWIIRAEKQG